MRILKSRGPIDPLSRILWITITALAVVLLLFVITDEPSLSIEDSGTLVAGMMLLFVAIGLRCNWGPIVPCALLGTIVAALLFEPISNSRLDPLYKDYVIPPIAAGMGAIAGMSLDLCSTINKPGNKFRVSTKSSMSRKYLPPGNESRF